ncbi:ecf subfamily rna polymerase sigma factor [Ophiostoma piceae UAMH 11346]|uniref:Ecf subfamily rna polymerase sigma factor n=1 Tax=Ophiostoma piceae (strain UAMH 11346) TaxID=1262450 RepID=S3BVR1_OPHP1|nr:ecf subfamily rna polymerase sigma factor [Ophiostoma piceae UAMH 11346]
MYASVVDTVKAAPTKIQTTAVLVNRNNNTAVVFNDTGNDFLCMFWLPQRQLYPGKGYFWARYGIALFDRIEPIIAPSWAGLSGKLFHVASNGGRRIDDLTGASPSCNWMGCDGGQDTLLAGMQQMRQNNYFYLDGNVTLNNNEGWAGYVQCGYEYFSRG